MFYSPETVDFSQSVASSRTPLSPITANHTRGKLGKGRFAPFSSFYAQWLRSPTNTSVLLVSLLAHGGNNKHICTSTNTSVLLVSLLAHGGKD